MAKEFTFGAAAAAAILAAGISTEEPLEVQVDEFKDAIVESQPSDNFDESVLDYDLIPPEHFDFKVITNVNDKVDALTKILEDGIQSVNEPLKCEEPKIAAPVTCGWKHRRNLSDPAGSSIIEGVNALLSKVKSSACLSGTLLPGNATQGDVIGVFEDAFYCQNTKSPLAESVIDKKPDFVDIVNSLKSLKQKPIESDESLFEKLF